MEDVHTEVIQSDENSTEHRNEKASLSERDLTSTVAREDEQDRPRAAGSVHAHSARSDAPCPGDERVRSLENVRGPIKISTR